MEPSGHRPSDLEDLPLDEVRFCVLDTETTGFDHVMDKVIEVAGVHMTIKGGIQHHGSNLVNPGRPIPANATEIHGLRDEDVASAGSLDEALAKIQERPFDVWAAHNATFDFGFLPPGNTPVVCTLVLARRLWPELTQHSNQSLRAHWNLESPEAEGLPAHRAEPDALVTAALLRHELKVMQDQFPEITTLGAFLDWMNTPFLLPYCAIGNKYRGMPWSDVPKSYLTWMLEKFEGLDLDLKMTIKHHLEG